MGWLSERKRPVTSRESLARNAPWCPRCGGSGRDTVCEHGSRGPHTETTEYKEGRTRVVRKSRCDGEKQRCPRCHGRGRV